MIHHKTDMIKKRGLDNPREVRFQDYPDDATIESRLKFLVNYAVLAPSTHNTQPWLFRVLNHTVEIHADRSRALPVLDPEDRCLTISCGSCIALMESALSVFGFKWTTTLMPDFSNPDLLARITVRGEADKADVDTELARAIVSRSTIRRGFMNLPLPKAFLDSFDSDRDNSADTLCAIHDEEAERLILQQTCSMEEDMEQDIHFRRESESWTHPIRSRSRDGIPEKPGMSTPITVCWSDQDAGTDTTRLSALCVVSNTPLAWLSAGMTLMQALIEASRFGVNAAMINIPSEAKHLADVVSRLTSCNGIPVLLVRFGRPGRKVITQRRPLVDVMLHPGFSR